MKGQKVDMSEVAALKQAIGRNNKIVAAANFGELPLAMAGGYAAYPVSENILRGKDKLFGGEGLSPTDKLIMEQQLAQEEQIRMAYEAGLAGAYGDPYTGDVPLNSGYIYG